MRCVFYMIYGIEDGRGFGFATNGVADSSASTFSRSKIISVEL